MPSTAPETPFVAPLSTLAEVKDEGGLISVAATVYEDLVEPYYVEINFDRGPGATAWQGYVKVWDEDGEQVVDFATTELDIAVVELSGNGLAYPVSYATTYRGQPAEIIWFMKDGAVDYVFAAVSIDTDGDGTFDTWENWVNPFVQPPESVFVKG